MRSTRLAPLLGRARPLFFRVYSKGMQIHNTLSDSELISTTKSLAAEERSLTARVLTYLEEIERRKLHLSMGFASLFDFCLRELSYSRDEAYYRINAMRLSREVPEAVAAIEDGKLSLTNVARAQSFFRKEKKEGRSVSQDAKRELLHELQGLSTRECERKLESLRPEPRRQVISFEVDDETLAGLQRIRELWGNHDLSEAELFKKMILLVLTKIDPERRKGRAEHSVGAQRLPDEPPAEMITPQNRHVPAQEKREVWVRDEGRCTFRSPKTGRRCNSKYALQFDHLDLYGKGGSHSPENLVLLCRAHHRLKSTGI